jgi:hypothetical protein
MQKYEITAPERIPHPNAALGCQHFRVVDENIQHDGQAAIGPEVVAVEIGE